MRAHAVRGRLLLGEPVDLGVDRREERLGDHLPYEDVPVGGEGAALGIGEHPAMVGR